MPALFSSAQKDLRLVGLDALHDVTSHNVLRYEEAARCFAAMLKLEG